MSEDPSKFSKEYRCRKPEKKVQVPKKKAAIRPMSKKLAKERKMYRELRQEFLEKPENMFCAVYPSIPADQIHHMRGRGKYLNDTSTWLGVSGPGHEWIEQNPKLAKERGFTKSRLSMTDQLNENE